MSYHMTSWELPKLFGVLSLFLKVLPTHITLTACLMLQASVEVLILFFACHGVGSSEASKPDTLGTAAYLQGVIMFSSILSNDDGRMWVSYNPT